MNPTLEDSNITTDTLFASIIGYTGSTVAIFFFISPIKLFLEANKTKNLKNVPYILLIASYLNCLFWIIYGAGKKQNPQWICNSIGILFNFVWLIWHAVIYYKDDAMKKILIIVIYTCSLVVTALGLFYILQQEKDWQKLFIDIIGYAACVLNVIMYASPGQNIIQVFKTGDFNLIPIVSCVIGFFCSVLWLTYSFVDIEARTNTLDIQCFIPNVLGSLFTPFQIIVWYIFKKKSKSEELNEDENKLDKNII